MTNGLTEREDCGSCLKLVIDAVRIVDRDVRDEARSGRGRGQNYIYIFPAEFYIFTPFSQKNIRSIFDGTSKILAQDGLYHGALTVNTPKTTSYAFGRRLLLLWIENNKALQQHFKNYKTTRPSWTKPTPQLLRGQGRDRGSFGASRPRPGRGLNIPCCRQRLMACSHRRRDETRQFCLVRVGGVNKSLDKATRLQATATGTLVPSRR